MLTIVDICTQIFLPLLEKFSVLTPKSFSLTQKSFSLTLKLFPLLKNYFFPYSKIFFSYSKIISLANKIIPPSQKSFPLTRKLFPLLRNDFPYSKIILTLLENYFSVIRKSFQSRFVHVRFINKQITMLSDILYASLTSSICPWNEALLLAAPSIIPVCRVWISPVNVKVYKVIDISKLIWFLYNVFRYNWKLVFLAVKVELLTAISAIKLSVIEKKKLSIVAF